ncbi:MAG: ankyrin repeat domain-containing protein [Deltaproteobacteria bacterium]|nr:ankyrin repeat domain-containing protein [Deltaproteobacteria bacterium]
MHKLVKIFFVLIFAFVFGCQNQYYDEPPLHAAAMRGSIKKVKQLIKEGASVNGVNKQGATALHWAASKGHEDIVEYLVRHGANVNALTNKGSTPLKLANDFHHKKVIKLLQGYGARM